LVIQCHIQRGYVVGVIWKMTFTKKNEEAVSPVIGVILMVAITVILAAVIAAFVFGMAGNIQKTKVVAATTERINTDTVRVVYQGGQDSIGLQSINFTVNDTLSAGPMINSNNDLEVGTSYTLLPKTSTNAPGKNHIVGVGFWADGTKQVIIDTTV